MTRESIIISLPKTSIKFQAGDYISMTGKFGTYKVTEAFTHSIKLKRIPLLAMLKAKLRGLFR